MNGSSEDGNQVTILAVEPNSNDAQLLREVFADAKLVNALHIVDSGDAALDFLYQRNDYAESPRPNLILLDPEVPGTPGEQILTQLDEESQLRRTPVIVISSSDSKEDIARSYDLNANAYIRKPIDHDEFAKALQAIEEFWFRIVRLPPKAEDEDEGGLIQ